MPRTALNKLIPKADYLLVRAFPKVAQRLDKEVDGMDRAEIDAYLKLLPGAIERFQTAAVAVNDLHETVEGAILQLVTSFGSRNASEVEPMPLVDISNTLAELEETTGGVSDSDQPEGSDAIQEPGTNTLSRNELAAAPGNGVEPDSSQASPRNSRVRSASRLQGRAAARRRGDLQVKRS